MKRAKYGEPSPDGKEAKARCRSGPVKRGVGYLGAPTLWWDTGIEGKKGNKSLRRYSQDDEDGKKEN